MSKSEQSLHDVIYLQIAGEGYDSGQPTTWCQDKINDTDVAYVRVPAGIENPKEAVQGLVAALDWLVDMTGKHVADHERSDALKAAREALKPWRERGKGV